MPRIFDNIEADLLPALAQTLCVSERADFCVGYFNLRGWKAIDALIDQWVGGEGAQCRLIVGMQRLAQDELRQAYSLLPEEEEISQKAVIRLKRRLAEEFRAQLTFGAPTDEDECGLRRLSAQLKAGKVVVKLFLRHTLHAKLYLCFRPDPNNPITGFLGSSNLTLSGLSHQGELNVDVLDQDATDKLAKWFKDRWNDRWCVDITQELIQVIDESWARPECLPPYQIYVKMAYHLAEEARAGLSEFSIPPDMRGTLLEFQSAAVRIAARHLEKRGGVILGDVVGLASVMLNRLMFVYFIQRKGFLDGDHDYLRNRLDRCKKEQGKNQFYTFYRYFLLRLFHEGFGKRRKDRAPDLEKLIGNIPYLNGGLFDVHELEKPERYGKEISIEDKAFERVFDYFDQYQWHLDERPLRNDKEINPDVLGYIFEKYINQKQMGAYYTKEDITEYISKNTVLPFIFDAARAKCKVAFENADGPAVWDLLRENPDRYIYPAVRHGADKKLPPEIAAGLDPARPNLLERRTPWNKPAPGDYALPTEIWREVVARRQRYEEVRQKLTTGQVREVNDFITLNLDLRQFAQDVIQSCEGPDLLMALWQPITTITVLDPTGGSGAFIFAALSILEPLYEACLDRMEAFLAEWGENGKKTHPNYHKKFSEVLARVDAHPNRRYFVLKSIILNNLYAVDIMEEAVEICKLRLFLKLAAQVDPDATKDNLGIEPLPDIDFNIRAGNTLIGYATKGEVQRCMKEVGGGQMKLMDEGDLGSFARFNTRCADVEQAFAKFRQLQTEGDGSVPYADKQELQRRLKALEDELNRHLAGEYGVKLNDKIALTKWLKSHLPFHWFVQFYGILAKGGFDVIIGNPPYLEIREVDYALKNYACLDSGAIHAMCIERSARLLHRNGCMSMIVPLSLPSTQRMEVVQKILEADRNAWYANYSWRPAKLFDTVNRALTIFVVTPSERGHTFSTCYQKWTSDDRDGLFGRLHYIEVLRPRSACWIPKLGDPLENEILKKCLVVKTPIKYFTGDSGNRVYYRTDGGLYWKVFTDFAPAFNLNGKKGHSSRETWFTMGKKEYVKPIIAALSSDVFWWWYTVTSNVRHLNPFDIQNFPIPESALADSELQTLGARYLKDLDKNSAMLVREQKQTGTTETQSFKIQKSLRANENGL